MRILLLGEYSGLHKALKEGLEEMGQKVELAANGDGKKKISGATMPLFNTDVHASKVKKLMTHGIAPILDKRFRNYDVVQAISPNAFSWVAGSIPLDKVKRYNKKLFVLAAGVNAYIYEAWANKNFVHDYYMFDDNMALCNQYNGVNIVSKILNHTCRKVMNYADGIIPVVPYEYELPYKKLNNLKRPILLPVNTDKVAYRENKVSNKIIFFHGVTRRKDKGSDFIIEAFKRIEDRYPNDAECIIADMMPYKEYLETIKRSNVIVDQCKSFGYGLNACLSLAQGRVVMSGAEDEVVKKIAASCPVINIRPSVEHIVAMMEMVIANKDNIGSWGEKGRRYIEEYHDYKKIAKLYLNMWNE